MSNAVERLKDLQRLLQIEREEDLLQYHERQKTMTIAERRAIGTCWYPVVITGTGFTATERPYIEVERPANQLAPHQFQGGRGVTLFRNSGGKGIEESVSGVIRNAGFNNLKIILQADDFPDWMDDGKLGVELLFDDLTYKEMDKALKQVIAADKGRVAELREILYGNKSAQYFAKNPAYVPASHLNGSQQKAVEKVLSAKDVAVVHGPPGTGKTTTLAEAISQTLQIEKQVLVCAPSNTAVDLLTEKLAVYGINVLRLGNPARVSEDLLRHTPDAKMTAHKDYALIRQLRRSATEYNQMASKYKRQFGKAEREQRKQILGEARKLSREAEDVERYILESLFSEAQVVTCTPVGAVSRLLESKRFSTVFIDEAAQAMEPACWIPIIKAERVIFAGDPYQLPPTVKSMEAAKGGLSVSLVEKVVDLPEVSTMLEVQYRMHQDIMQFSNEQFYGGRLEAHASVKDAVLGAEEDILANPLEFIDTAGCGFEEKINPETLSTYNPEEANLMLRHLSALLEKLEVKCPQMPVLRNQIGIISPYKAHIEYIQTQLKSYPVLSKWEKAISIGTVDGFQGQEREVIYISLVRSNDAGEIGFLADTRRMNVALTRAKKKLVVIGDSATLGGHTFYQSFLNYAETYGHYKSAWEFMD